MRRSMILARLALGCAATALSGPLLAQAAPPIVQPGAPGQPSRTISAQEAAKLAGTSYIAADVAFVQAMIPHHAQALEMAALVPTRTQRKEVREAAERIRLSQDGEIAQMRQWLAARGETVPVADTAGHVAHAGHDAPAGAQGDHAGHGMAMTGMLTPAQLASLAAARGEAFDRLFLQLMIQHHQGALDMVANLMRQPGTAHDPTLFALASEIANDQRAEITRMNMHLAGLSSDPRVGLAPGFRNAGEAASNLRLVSTLAKPEGFFDPTNPAGLQPVVPPAPKASPAPASETRRTSRRERQRAQRREAKPASGQAGAAAKAPEAARRFAERYPLLSFANTDLAFAGDVLVAGNYHGFNIYRLGSDGTPALVSSVVCPGGQGDVSVVGKLLIMSVEQTRGRVDCGTQGVTGDVSPDRFRGLRIFDISDLARPRQVGLVQTCRGSHTHSVVNLPERDGKIVVYNSGTAAVRDSRELAGCTGGGVSDQSALFSIDVIEIPLANPGAARIVDSPRVFADEQTGAIAGLWRGGNHGDGTQTTSVTDQCHDITVFPTRSIAAGACSGNGIVLDISDPRKPKRIDAVVDKGFAYWHSATFNNDGTKVVFTDEWGGGVQPRCRAGDPRDWGADAIYDIVDGKLQRRATFKIAAPQTDNENCVAHNGSIVPVPGRDIMVQAWYQGGLSVFDFTDSNAPVEIAFFDRGPINTEQTVVGGYWSAYFHRGRIYATEIVRGLDMLALEPSAQLSANEIAAAALAQGEGTFNPQRQTPVTWPAVPVVALAYLDQLERGGALPAERVAMLRTDLEAARGVLDGKRRDTALAGRLAAAARGLQGARVAGQADARRVAALGDTLGRIAVDLR